LEQGPHVGEFGRVAAETTVEKFKIILTAPHTAHRTAHWTSSSARQHKAASNTTHTHTTTRTHVHYILTGCWSLPLTEKESDTRQSTCPAPPQREQQRHRLNTRGGTHARTHGTRAHTEHGTTCIPHLDQRRPRPTVSRTRLDDRGEARPEGEADGYSVFSDLSTQNEVDLTGGVRPNARWACARQME
jgi:hypothetical protein